mmetsp:Transcript_32083/g.80535  ORF Transcript_32083/g.80535 Transcript_32083/m.80535 type:complete len:248 (-) Transcript_32083:309-1052(-)
MTKNLQSFPSPKSQKKEMNNHQEKSPSFTPDSPFGSPLSASSLCVFTKSQNVKRKGQRTRQKDQLFQESCTKESTSGRVFCLSKRRRRARVDENGACRPSMSPHLPAWLQDAPVASPVSDTLDEKPGSVCLPKWLQDTRPLLHNLPAWMQDSPPPGCHQAPRPRELDDPPWVLCPELRDQCSHVVSPPIATAVHPSFSAHDFGEGRTPSPDPCLEDCLSPPEVLFWRQLTSMLMNQSHAVSRRVQGG